MKIRPFFKDLSLTFIAETIVLISFFFAYRLIAENYNEDGVGEYSLVKRVFGFIQPLLLLGLAIGLPRYIAIAQNKAERGNYVKAASFIVGILTIIVIIFVNIFKEEFAKIFFGNHTTLVTPFLFLLIGLTLHTVVYSYLRGRLLAVSFNLLQIINLALVPLVILIFSAKYRITFEKVITLIGIMNLIISMVFSLFFFKELFFTVKYMDLKNSLKELLRYSFPRFLASFVYAGFLSLGPIIAVHFASISEVGFLSISQSLLTTVAVIISPLGLLLLPKVSTLIKEQREDEIKENLNYLIGATIQISIFICFQLIIFSDAIIKYWLGQEFTDAIPIMRIIFCSVIFYLFCGAVGSVLEASAVKPINLINLCISLGTFLVISMFLLFLVKLFSPIISLSIAFTSGLSCLGILTHISIRKIYFEKLNKDLNYLWIAIGINILLGAVAILAKPFIVYRFYYLVTFEILIGFIYLSILWLLKMDWLRKIPEKIFSEINKS